MKICKNCNAVIDEDAKVCTFCGADQSVIQSDIKTELDNDNQSESFGAYYTPGSDVQSASYNSAAAPKKKSGKKILSSVISIIIAVVIVFVVKNVLMSGLEGKIDPGVIDVDSYTNSSVDLRINCPDDWEIITGTQLAEIAGGTVIDDGRVQYQEGGVYECMLSTDIGENIIVAIIDGNIADALTSEEEFIDDMAESFSAKGTVGPKYQLQLGGNTYNCIDCDSVVKGVDVQQTMCVVKDGNQYFAVIFTLFPEDSENTVQSFIDNYFTSAN